jgi:hypothetical protein
MNRERAQVSRELYTFAKRTSAVGYSSSIAVGYVASTEHYTRATT